jgi:hypothetical protein
MVKDYQCVIHQRQQSLKTRILVQYKCILILVGIVQASLWDSILDLNGALEVLLVCELHSFVHYGCIFFRGWSQVLLELLLHLNHGRVGYVVSIAQSLTNMVDITEDIRIETAYATGKVLSLLVLDVGESDLAIVVLIAFKKVVICGEVDLLTIRGLVSHLDATHFFGLLQFGDWVIFLIRQAL